MQEIVELTNEEIETAIRDYEVAEARRGDLAAAADAARAEAVKLRAAFKARPAKPAYLDAVVAEQVAENAAEAVTAHENELSQLRSRQQRAIALRDGRKWQLHQDAHAQRLREQRAVADAQPNAPAEPATPQPKLTELQRTIATKLVALGQPNPFVGPGAR
jgi:hypothetical protein